MLHSHCDFMGHKEVHTWNRSGVVGDGCHDGGGGGRGVPVWHAVPASTLPMPGPSLTGGGGGLNVPANTFSVPGPSLVVAVPAVPVPPGHVDVATGHHDWHGIFYLQPCEVPGIVSVSVPVPVPATTVAVPGIVSVSVWQPVPVQAVPVCASVPVPPSNGAALPVVRAVPPVPSLSVPVPPLRVPVPVPVPY